METKSKSAFGGLLWIIILLVVSAAARFFLSSDESKSGNQNTDSQKAQEQTDEHALAEEARQGVGNAKASKSEKLPEWEKSPDCVDYRDGGDDIFTKWSTYSKGKLRQEYCNFQDNPANTSVNEFSCNRVDPIADNRVKCPEGYSCSDGACVTANANSEKAKDIKMVESTGAKAETGS